MSDRFVPTMEQVAGYIEAIKDTPLYDTVFESVITAGGDPDLMTEAVWALINQGYVDWCDDGENTWLEVTGGGTP